MSTFTSNMDISTSQKLPIPFNPGYYMLKSGVVVQWPKVVLGYRRDLLCDKVLSGPNLWPWN